MLSNQLVLFTALISMPMAAQTPRPWQDDLVNRLVGSWKLEGTVMGSTAHHDVKADWVLNHQFLCIQEKTAANAPATERAYDSIWYLGYDPISERYVLHLMDTFGARFSETLGYGARDGSRITFVFEYPDGPFHNTYVWNAEGNSWQWVMEQKDKDGKWVSFANLRLTKVEGPPRR